MWKTKVAWLIALRRQLSNKQTDDNTRWKQPAAANNNQSNNYQHKHNCNHNHSNSTTISTTITAATERQEEGVQSRCKVCFIASAMARSVRSLSNSESPCTANQLQATVRSQEKYQHKQDTRVCIALSCSGPTERIVLIRRTAVQVRDSSAGTAIEHCGRLERARHSSRVTSSQAGQPSCSFDRSSKFHES